MTIGKDSNGIPTLLVALPGGTFCTIDQLGNVEHSALVNRSSTEFSFGAQTEIICLTSNDSTITSNFCNKYFSFSFFLSFFLFYFLFFQLLIIFFFLSFFVNSK